MFPFGMAFQLSHFLPYALWFRSMQARHKGDAMSIHSTVFVLQSHMLLYPILLVATIIILCFAVSTFKSSSLFFSMAYFGE